MLIVVVVPVETRGSRLTRVRQAFDSDVRVWRSPPPLSQCHSNVPRSVIQHSPDGFECGYAGSGPADLALNILNAFLPPRAGCPTSFCESERDDDPVQMYRGVASRFAMRWHQKFKFEFIATMARSGGDISAELVRSWIAEQRTVTE